MEDRPDSAGEARRADIEDLRAVRFYGWHARMEDSSGTSADPGGVADREHEAPGVVDERLGVAVGFPPGLGGPREFAVPGHQLIALMEHVAAVRRLARRGWRCCETAAKHLANAKVRDDIP